MNKHIRNIKLYELEIGTEGKELHDFLKEQFIDIKEYKDDNYTDYLFYGKSKDNIIMEWYNYKGRDQRNDILYVKYGGLWSVFESKFNMKLVEIQLLTQWWVSRELNLKATNNRPIDSLITNPVGREVNLKATNVISYKPNNTNNI